MTAKPKSKLKWARWLLLFVVIIVLVVAGAWFYALNQIRHQLDAQLEKLELGKHKISDVSIGGDGIQATGVEFFKVANGQIESRPWLSIDSFEINHDLSGLIAGDEYFDQLKATGLKVEVDVSAPNAEKAFDLSDIDIPAKSLQVSDATFIAKSDEGNVVIEGIDLELKTGKSHKLTGSIDNFLGNRCQVSGSLETKSQRWFVKLTSKKFDLKNDQWQRIPSIPDNLAEYVQTDATFDFAINLTGSNFRSIDYAAKANIANATIQLPQFDLPINIKQAEVSAQDGQLEYKNVIATVDGTDKLIANGTGTFDDFFNIDFEVNFENLDIATARKLATPIPASTNGRFSGTAIGSVSVKDNLRTVVTLDGNANSNSARYGEVASDGLGVKFVVQPLVFDETLAFEKLAGKLTINGKAKEQPVEKLLRSLDLDDLNKQLAIDALGTGTFQLMIPLDNAADLSAWDVNVSANTPTALISGQRVDQIELSAQMKSGQFRLATTKAVPVTAAKDQPTLASPNDQDPSLNLTVEWPIANPAATAAIGKVAVTGKSLAPRWVVDFLTRQIDISNGPDSNTFEMIHQSPLKDLNGNLNFDANLAIDADKPDKVSLWQASATIADSALNLKNEQLQLASSSIEIEKGLLHVNEAEGQLSSGGNITGEAVFSIQTGKFRSATVSGNSIPASWLAKVGASRSPEVAKIVARLGNSEAIDGNINLTLAIPKNGDRLPVDNVLLSADSNRISIRDQVLSDVSFNSTFNATGVTLRQANALIGPNGWLELKGDWNWQRMAGPAVLKWKTVSLDRLAKLIGSAPVTVAGSTSGEVQLTPDNANATVLPGVLSGEIFANGVEIGQLKSKSLSFNVRSDGDILRFSKFQFDDEIVGLDVTGQLGLRPPYNFKSAGDLSSVRLSRIFALPSVVDPADVFAEISGIADGTFNLEGELAPFDWRSSGNFVVRQPSVNRQSIRDISATWSDLGSGAKQSKASIDLFGGKIELLELNQTPQRLKVEISNVSAAEVSNVLSAPVAMTGQLSGDAALSDWSLAETRRADLNLRGASIKVGYAQFGDLDGHLDFQNGTAQYSLSGRFVGGKFTSNGSTSVTSDDFENLKIPLTVDFDNGQLGQFYKKSPFFSSIRPLRGSLSAKADMVFTLNGPPAGSGVLRARDLKWDNQLLTREITSTARLAEQGIIIEDLRADLRRGEASGKAFVPFKPSATGNYQFRLRQFDLQRFLKIVVDESIDGAGSLDARVSGQLGKSVTGQGSISINRSKLLGLTGETLQVPIRFSLRPQQASGHVEFRDSRFRMFHGNVSGSASVNFGSRFDLDTDLTFSKIDTADVFKSIAGLRDSGQGDLSGHLKLHGTSIRSMRDLTGSFNGRLDRTELFQLPLLNQIGRFLGGNQLQAKEFDSDDIEIRLAKGKANIRRLNLSNSLANIIITGDAYTDGRLNLDVAARIERLNQPTLLDQLAGSPLTRLQGSPVSFFAQAADFLSERLVFLKVAGTIRRPQIRPDSGKQLREEAIRYFLRGSQILPIRDPRNN
jgi:hypothetical protein